MKIWKFRNFNSATDTNMRKLIQSLICSTFHSVYSRSYKHVLFLGVVDVPGESLVGEDLKFLKFQQCKRRLHARISPNTNFKLFILFIPEVVSMWPFWGYSVYRGRHYWVKIWKFRHFNGATEISMRKLFQSLIFRFSCHLFQKL